MQCNDALYIVSEMQFSILNSNCSSVQHCKLQCSAVKYCRVEYSASCRSATVRWEWPEGNPGLVDHCSLSLIQVSWWWRWWWWLWLCIGGIVDVGEGFGVGWLAGCRSSIVCKNYPK